MPGKKNLGEDDAEKKRKRKSVKSPSRVPKGSGSKKHKGSRKPDSQQQQAVETSSQLKQGAGATTMLVHKVVPYVLPSTQEESALDVTPHESTKWGPASTNKDKVAFSPAEDKVAFSPVEGEKENEQPKKLFRDVSYVPPEETLEAIREGRRQSVWQLMKKEDTVPSQEALLESVLNRITPNVEPDVKEKVQQKKTVVQGRSSSSGGSPAMAARTKSLSPFSKFYDRYLSRKRGDVSELSSREWITVCGGSIMLLPFMFAIAIIILKMGRTPVTLVDCNSAECKNLFQELVMNVNDNVDPCDDFYAFVCGADTNDLVATAPTSFIRRLNATLMAAPELTSSDQYGSHIMIKFYKVCYAFMSNKASVSLGDMAVTASVFLDVQFMLDSNNISDVMMHLASVSLSKGISTTFKLEVLRNDTYIYGHFRTETSIRVKMARTLVDLDAGQAMPLMSDGELETYMNHVLHSLGFNDNASELVKMDKDVEKTLSTPIASRYIEFQELAQLVAPYSPETLLILANGLLPRTRQLRSVHEKIYAEGIEQALALRNLTDDQSVRGWSLYYTLHLLTGVLRFYRVPSTEPTTIAMACLGMTRKVLTHTWPYLVSRTLHSPASKVVEMGRSILSTITAANLNQWMDGTMRFRVDSKLKKLSLISYEESKLKIMEDVSYLRFKVEDDGFVKVFLALTKFATGLLQQVPPTVNTYTLSLHQLTSNLTYDDGINSIVVPSAYQEPPFMYASDDIAFYFNYATLGALITREVIHATSSSWSGAEKFAVFMDCIKEVHRSLGMHDAEDEAAWNRSAFALTFGARLTYDVVRHLVKQRGEDVFTNSWPNVERVLFLRLCMMSCGQEGKPIVPREQCLLPLHANPEFMRHYECEDKPTFKMTPCISSIFT
ncbi:uncharacterized protein LOC135393258 isoform X2 [Ornithodoros turicata]|uniref:uncharacterized protein LOC135393258 isoform X2 n=1 Tax=Ornithodoros turicata TaxID=34597 RepID=UPI003139428F